MTDRARRRRLLVAGPAVVVGHGLALLALIFAQPAPPRLAEPEPMIVALVAPPPPPPVEAPRVPQPAATKPPPPPPRVRARPTPRPPPDIIPVVVAAKRPSANGSDELSESEVASAGTADSGAGGHGCDMTRRLQSALRKDARVQAAVAEAHRGKALRIWNGDWVRHGEQEGDGMAAVREAIQWEVGFAPSACRGEQVHGLVLLSLADGPGAARLVVGAGDWRWSDLLFARGVQAR